MARRDGSDAPVFKPMRQQEPCKYVRDMNRRIDVTFDERLDGFPGIAGAMRRQSLLHGDEGNLRLPENP